jgi:hypothetical protein
MSVHDDLPFLSKSNSRHQLSEIEIAGRPKLLVLWAGQLWQGHVWIEILKVPTLGSTLQMMTDDGGQKKWRFRLWSFDRVNICCFIEMREIGSWAWSSPTNTVGSLDMTRQEGNAEISYRNLHRARCKRRMSVHNSTSKQQDTDQHRSIRHPKRLEDSWNSLKIMWVRQ